MRADHLRGPRRLLLLLPFSIFRIIPTYGARHESCGQQLDRAALP